MVLKDYWLNLNLSIRNNNKKLFNHLMNQIKGNNDIEEYHHIYGNLLLKNYTKNNKSEYDKLFKNILENGEGLALFDENKLIKLFNYEYEKETIVACIYKGIFYLFTPKGLIEKTLI